jgi:hypothetical protein
MGAIAELDQVEKKQNISDIIWNIQSEETPAMSMLGKGEDSSQALFEATLEKLPDVGFTGIANGVDVSSWDGVLRTKVGMYVHEFRRPFMVDQRAQNTEYAGVAKKKEYARQKVLAMVALKQMMEQAVLSDNECQSAAAPATPYETRGAVKWMSESAQAVLPVPAAHRPASGAVLDGTTLAAVTETAVQTVLNLVSRARRGAASTFQGFCGQDLLNVFDKWAVYADAGASFATFPVRTWAQEKGAVIRGVTKLQFQTGTIWLHPSIYLMKTKADGTDSASTHKSGVFLNTEFWGTRWQMRPETHDLADEGGGPRGYVRAMMGLDCKAPASSFYITAAS